MDHSHSHICFPGHYINVRLNPLLDNYWFCLSRNDSHQPPHNIATIMIGIIDQSDMKVHNFRDIGCNKMTCCFRSALDSVRTR